MKSGLEGKEIYKILSFESPEGGLFQKGKEKGGEKWKDSNMLQRVQGE